MTERPKWQDCRICSDRYRRRWEAKQRIAARHRNRLEEIG